MEEEKTYWTMEDIVSITETVQEAELEYNGKYLKLQWCELTEAEEPKLVIPSDDIPEEEKTKLYIEMAADRTKKAISKADKKNPEGAQLDINEWEKIPTTLRFAIQNKVLGAGTNFQNG